MAKIQTTLGLTTRAKAVLNDRCQKLGMSQNQYIEALILDSPQVKKNVKASENCAIFYEELQDGSMWDVELYEAHSGSIFGKIEVKIEPDKREKCIELLTKLCLLLME